MTASKPQNRSLGYAHVGTYGQPRVYGEVQQLWSCNVFSLATEHESIRVKLLVGS